MKSTFRTISIKANEKIPTVSGWGCGASPEHIDDLDKIARRTKGNYGVLCGPRSNIIVIDYDTDKMPNCPVTLETLKASHGDTMIVQTPKGGFHVYHVYESRFDTWVGRCKIGGYIDIRTHGNYVVGPGSKVDGREYRIVNDSEPNTMPEEIFNNYDPHARVEKHSIENQTIDDETLEKFGFTNICWVNNYDFDCDQRGRGTTCPLCRLTHENNHFFIWAAPDKTLFVKNHSNRCVRTKVSDETVYESNCIIKTDDDEYTVMKKTFDGIVFKVSDPLCYCIKRSEGRLQLCTFKQLREIYSTSILKDEKGHPYNFFDRWNKDPNKVEYENMDFLPPPLTCPSTTYNMWSGFNVKETKGGTIKPFLELMELVEGGKDYMTWYLADLVQNPGRLPEVGIVLRGLEGTGKNTITETIARLIGNDHYFSTTDPAMDVFCRFSEARYRKLCINFDEAEAKKMFSQNENIKGLITSPFMTYEQKGLTPIRVRSFARIITTTNNYAPLKISMTDRRLAVFQMREKFVGNKEHWDSYYTWLNKPENIWCLYEYLMKVDLSKVNLKNIPDTVARNEIQQSCLPLEIKWLAELIENFPSRWEVLDSIPSTALHTDFKLFLPTKCDIDSRSFGRMLIKNNFPGFTKGPRKSEGTTWKIYRDMVHKWLIEKKFIDPVSETSETT
jgi:hypothetical protein